MGIADEQLIDPTVSWEKSYKVWLYISAVIWLLVMVLLVWFSFKYRRRQAGRNVDGAYIPGNVGLEILWTAIPTVIVILLAAQTWGVFEKLRAVPEGAYEVKVEGYQFGFDMIYPVEGLKTINELVVPEGPVKLILESRDVVHGLYLPDYKTKEDMIPGRKTYVYFLAKPTDAGKKLPIYCTEYCGTKHSLMLATLEVKKKEDFEKWIASKTQALASASPEEKGKELIKQCTGCHSITGEASFGPSLKGIIGSQRALQDGTNVLADEAYVKESVRNPNAKIVKGFSADMMPPYPESTLADTDLAAIIAYLNTLK
jgi:cytochrome c oxidase subunit 2